MNHTRTTNRVTTRLSQHAKTSRRKPAALHRTLPPSEKEQFFAPARTHSPRNPGGTMMNHTRTANRMTTRLSEHHARTLPRRGISSSTQNPRAPHKQQALSAARVLPGTREEAPR